MIFDLLKGKTMERSIRAALEEKLHRDPAYKAMDIKQKMKADRIIRERAHRQAQETFKKDWLAARGIYLNYK
jgi:hypothetical protein